MSLAPLVPCALTVAGIAAGAFWLAGGPWWLVPLSLALDVLDGRVARRLGAVSDFGARLDWTGDVVLAAATVAAFAGPAWLAVYVPAVLSIDELRLGRRQRVSGRALVMLVALGLNTPAW